MNSYLEIVNTLKEIKHQLKHCDTEEIKFLMNTIYQKDRDMLIDLYMKEIDPLEKDDPIKVFVLTLLYDIGIQPIKVPSTKNIIK